MRAKYPMASDLLTCSFKSNDSLGFGNAYIKIENSFAREFAGKLGIGIPLGSSMIIDVDRTGEHY